MKKIKFIVIQKVGNTIVMIVHYSDISKPIGEFMCKHLTNEEFTSKHHKRVGLSIATFGVLLAHITAESSYFLIKFFGDLIGYGFHGLGLIPIFKNFEKEKEDIKIDKEEITEKTDYK
ncbi:MAG: hypothetical protein ABIP51_05935 [Bacteroidia bacterium]